MPAAAYPLLALFAAVSLLAGIVGAWVAGPRRPWAAILPALAAFGALYLVGHRLALSIGPQVRLLGFELSLVFDAAVAVGASLATAAVQAVGLRLLQADQRGTGRDRLA